MEFCQDRTTARWRGLLTTVYLLAYCHHVADGDMHQRLAPKNAGKEVSAHAPASELSPAAHEPPSRSVIRRCLLETTLKLGRIERAVCLQRDTAGTEGKRCPVVVVPGRSDQLD